MKCNVYIATSLDGFIATKEGGLDWLMEIDNPTGDDFGFGEFIESIDALVMGRNTFEMVVSFGQWPYTKPVYVLSSTLTSIPQYLQDKAFLVNGEIEEVLKNLELKGLKNLYIDGGKVIQSFLEKDLINEMIITRIPIVLGEGIALFSSMNKSIKFSHVKTEVLLGEMVKSHYRKIA